jgi:FKBP-type peptidyl-prolyl cis-trans isomerase FkpA
MLMKKIYITLIFGFSFLVYGCIKEDFQNLNQVQIDDKIIRNYIANNDVSAIKDPAGFYYEILRSNPSGQPIGPNDVVTVYYKICLLNGTVLEAKTSNNSSPLRFLHSEGGLVPEGINHGIGLMKTGEKFRFIIPSYMGFGQYYSLGYIGPNEVLIAEVELLSIENNSRQKKWEDDSIKSYLTHHNILNYESFGSGLHKYTIIPGSGQYPTEGRVVKAVMHRKYLNETKTHSFHDSDTVNIYLRKGENDYVQGASPATEGLKEGLMNMRRGETAVLLVPSHLAFGGKLINILDNKNQIVGYSGSIQVFPQKFRDEYVEKYLNMQNIYPLTILKYEIKILEIYMVQ